MMGIAYLLCSAAASDTCEERVHVFVPLIPVACIHAATPELDRIRPEGSTIGRWRCLEPDELLVALDAGG
jgi:hypothetical protein